MALQDGIIQLKGKLGNLSFYKTADGYIVRKKGGFTSQRVKDDPAFVRTRENYGEFGSASSASKTLRTAFRQVIQNCFDNRMHSRLTGRMTKIIQSDFLNERGLRKVSAGDLQLLNGFDFNKNNSLIKAFFAPYTVNIDRPNGKIILEVPDFVPTHMLSVPQAATHCILKAAAATIDFDHHKSMMSFSESAPIDINAQTCPAIQLLQLVTPGSTHPIFVVFGIEFFQMVNNIQYPLHNGAHSAMAIVKLDTGF
jgi:hypothetical protein